MPRLLNMQRLSKWILGVFPLLALCGCGLGPTSDLPPRAVIEASSLRGTAPLLVAFDGSRSTDAGTIVSYEWTFDGASNAAQGAQCSHTFTTGGAHTAALSVTDAKGLTGTARVDIVAENAPPLASFRLSDGAPIVNTLMTADGTGSLDPEGGALEFRWDFGDGAKAVGAVVTHVYEAEGAYLVTLLVRDPAGAEAMSSHRVLVQKIPSGGGCGGGRPIALR